jgi:hypothetical protein
MKFCIHFLTSSCQNLSSSGNILYIKIFGENKLIYKFSFKLKYKQMIMKAVILVSLTITVLSLSGKATTTRYCDKDEGACGCGTGNNHWQRTTFTGAAMFSIFGTKSWCGSGCGKCFKLTSEGWSPDGSGDGKGRSIVVMITDFCPVGPWCKPLPNKYGFKYHFDLNDCHQQISKLHWDNPVVDFTEVPCSSEQQKQFSSCQCHKKTFLKLDSHETDENDKFDFSHQRTELNMLTDSIEPNKVADINN